MEITKIKASARREIIADMLADALDIPDEVKNGLMEMADIQTDIYVRIKQDKAMNQKQVERYNDLCYKYFPRFQDGGEFTKEEPKAKTPNTERRFDFGEAIHMLKDGCKLSRDGWNGKEQYIILAKNIRFDTFDAKDWPALHRAIGSKAIAFVGTSGVQMGWLASQADMLAEDWHCVEVEG